MGYLLPHPRLLNHRLLHIDHLRQDLLHHLHRLLSYEVLDRNLNQSLLILLPQNLDNHNLQRLRSFHQDLLINRYHQQNHPLLNLHLLKLLGLSRNPDFIIKLEFRQALQHSLHSVITDHRLPLLCSPMPLHYLRQVPIHL